MDDEWEEFLSGLPSMYNGHGKAYAMEDSLRRQELQSKTWIGSERIEELIRQGGPRPKFLTQEENEYLNERYPETVQVHYKEVPIFRCRYYKPLVKKWDFNDPETRFATLPFEILIVEGTLDEITEALGFTPASRYCHQIGTKLVEIT